MTGQAFIHNGRMMLALPIKANGIESGQIFKKRTKKTLYVAYRHEGGELVAKKLRGKGTERFSRDYPLMLVI